MKADAPAAPPELEVPSWVPEFIAQFARARFAADVHRAYAAAISEIDKCEGDEARALAEDDGVRAAFADVVREDLVAIAERYRTLVCNHEMRNVWRELSRPRNGTFLHPARAPSSVANMEERQQAAMLELSTRRSGARTAYAGPPRRAAGPSSSAAVILREQMHWSAMPQQY